MIVYWQLFLVPKLIKDPKKRFSTIEVETVFPSNKDIVFDQNNQCQMQFNIKVSLLEQYFSIIT